MAPASIARICILTVVVSFVALGQTDAVPAKWIGTWTLSLQESKFGEVWGPGIPPSGLTVTGQTLKIAQTAGHLNIAGDTVTSEMGSVHEEFNVSLDEKETVVPPGVTISFRRIDDATFDVIVKANAPGIGNQVGENRFVFSEDGRKLTETKIHTERDQTGRAVIRTSTTILVFYRLADQK
jgi:hypothetical protein